MSQHSWREHEVAGVAVESAAFTRVGLSTPRPAPYFAPATVVASALWRPRACESPGRHDPAQRCDLGDGRCDGPFGTGAASLRSCPSPSTAPHRDFPVRSPQTSSGAQSK